jgi:hypothetical protein
MWLLVKVCAIKLVDISTWVRRLRYKPEGRGIDSRCCHWNFVLTWSFRSQYGPEVDSASNRNEYQEYFLVVKAAGASGRQPYHLHVPIVLKSGSLNLLEPSGSVKACNRIAFFAFMTASLNDHTNKRRLKALMQRTYKNHKCTARSFELRLYLWKN